MCLSFLLNIIEFNLNGILFWSIGFLIPIIILFPLFIFRVIGAGDIKLFAVIGSFMGYKFVLQSIIISFIIGAIVSLFKMIFQKSLKIRLQYFFNYVIYTLNTKDIKPYYNVQDGNTQIIPFTVVIAFGTLITVLKLSLMNFI